MPRVNEVLEEIVSQLPGYEPRPQQVRMAETIQRAIKNKRHALIEAGTGSGKSFGYLIPLLEHGGKAVIATATIALQEQLLHKDLPFLAQAYGREIKVALAKGRQNYICLHKLTEAHRHVALTDPQRPVIDQLVQINAKRDRSGGWSGDRAELPFTIDNRFWRENLASDAEDCLGPKCPNFQHTPHRKARIACDEAQIIIANHALYFTDIINEVGLLPKHDVVVFDEAHHLEKAAIAALSVQIQRWMHDKFQQRLDRRFRTVPSSLVLDFHDAQEVMAQFLFRKGRGQFKIEPDEEFVSRAYELKNALTALGDWLGATDAGQMQLPDVGDPEQQKQRAEVLRDQMRAVAYDMAYRWGHFAELKASMDRANWMLIDPDRDRYELQSAPLDVGAALAHALWEKHPAILCSATLAVDGRFDFIRRELGLPDNTFDLVLGSPFDFPRQALLYLPQGMPEPHSPEFSAAAAAEIGRILAMTQGRAFILCTSYRSMRDLSARLIPELSYPCKTQEELPRARLVEWFRTTDNAVLFATATFWEGVDIPGDALSCVVIDKLPFVSPDDPVNQARTERMKARGEDWFGDYVLPKAVLALKQGFGRLIRTKTDTGLVAILDRRVMTKRYGGTILRSLPAARRLLDLPVSLEAGLNPAQEPFENDRWGEPPPEPEPVYA